MTATPRARSTRLRALIAIASLVAATAACSDDDDSSAPAEPATTNTATDDNTIDVTAIDYAFEGLPAEATAGAELTLRNQSASEVHELVAMRLTDGEDRPAADLVALPEQELGGLFGGPPALVLIAPPDDDGFAAVGDGTLTEPGRYLMVCFIPTGADPGAYLDALEANPGQPPSVPGGPPHFTAGMYAELTVR